MKSVNLKSVIKYIYVTCNYENYEYGFIQNNITRANKLLRKGEKVVEEKFEKI